MEKRIHHLLQQFISGTITHEEEEELNQLLDANSSLVYEGILKIIFEEDDNVQETVDPKWNAILDKILSIDKPKRSPLKLITSNLKWIAAAAVILVFSLVAYFALNVKKTHEFSSDVSPGKNKAILTLADGREISLNDATADNVIKEAGILITKTTDGKLIYTIQSTNRAIDDSKTNTISTPNGGEWEVRLPDGSIVWLNAASSLKYPLNIASSKQRIVELAGEAYFEVAKDKLRPFMVKTTKQEIEVLGTHFNVNSYLNEPVTRTTLLEGSVLVSNLDRTQKQVLKPGEESVLFHGSFEVRNVNVDEAIAWKNGYFMFNNERQESILRKLARWYNVEVEYADAEVKNVMYYGTVSRFEKISKVLRKLEQTGEVRFDIKGNKVIVYNN